MLKISLSGYFVDFHRIHYLLMLVLKTDLPFSTYTGKAFFCSFAKKMKASIEISHYAFDEEFVVKVQEFIDALHEEKRIEISTNALSTQVFGDYDIVMDTLKSCMKKHFASYPSGAFVVKILSGDARIYLNND
jgi:uncharacterized protein YqgV (UPF0045/DUF77 family)